MIYVIGNEVNYINIRSSTIEDMVDYFSGKDEIGFDTETTGFDPYTCSLLSYQLGDSHNQFVVDANQYPINIIEDLLKKKLLIIHNAKFDLKFLYHNDIYPTRIWDTYLGECVLHKGDKSVRKGLDATLSRYTIYSLNKSIRDVIHREGFTERVIRYAAEDTEYLGLIKAFQISKLKQYDLMRSMDLENEFVKVLTFIEYSGIKLDKDLWTRKIIQNEKDYKESLDELNNWIIDNNLVKYIDTQLDLFDDTKSTTISWSSPTQVVELFKSLGINTQVPDEKNGGFKDSVEANILEKQIDKSPIIPIYLKYKQQEKLLSTYGKAVLDKINPATGRIHTQFTQIMDTGRLSSGGKMGDQETMNIQNIPRLPDKDDRIDGYIYERECFVPEEGNVFINADYSGQEQVVFANWTKDPDLIAFYKSNLGDMHSFIASKIFPKLKDVPLKRIKEEYKEERQIAKSAGFAINYGGDGNTIADNLNLPKERGEEIYNSYFKAFPGVSEYFKKATAQALRDGYILFNDISKSKCFISFINKYREKEKIVNSPGFWEKYREEKKLNSDLYKYTLKPDVSSYFKLRGNISRMALNYPIQGSSSEVTKIACIHIYNYILDNDLMDVVKFPNVIHDEVLLECPKHMGETMKKIVEDCMERAGNVYCKIVPLKAEASICNFWNH